LVVAAKFLVTATKNLFVVPNFAAATKPFFSVWKLRTTDKLRFEKWTFPRAERQLSEALGNLT